MNIYTMPKRNYNMLTPSMKNLNNEIVHASNNLKTNINKTLKKHHRLHVRHTPVNLNEIPKIHIPTQMPQSEPSKIRSNLQIKGTEEQRLRCIFDRCLKRIESEQEQIYKPQAKFKFGPLHFFGPPDHNVDIERRLSKHARHEDLGGASRKKTKTRKNRKKRKTRKRKQKIEKTKQTKKSHYIP